MYAVRISRRDVTDLSRSVGGLLFAVGAVVLFIRKSGDHQWSDFTRLLVVLVPAVALYVLALGVLERPRSEHARPWQSALMVASILLWPVALFQLLHWAGASTNHLLYNAAVFAVTGLLAGYAARRARIPYAALLAGLSLLLAWLFVWGKVLNHPSADTGRWLLLVAAALLLAAAAGFARAKAIGAGEVATAGGVAAVAAGVLGVILGSFVALFRSFLTLGETSTTGSFSAGSMPSHPISPAGMPRRVRSYALSHHGVSSHPLALHRAFSSHRAIPGRHTLSTVPSLVHAVHTSGLQYFGWDVYLLVVSLALIWIASRAHIRGIGYVGGIGLLAFIISVGAQITRLESGHHPTASIVGWPLVLLIVGVVGVVAPVLYRRET